MLCHIARMLVQNIMNIDEITVEAESETSEGRDVGTEAVDGNSKYFYIFFIIGLNNHFLTHIRYFSLKFCISCCPSKG